MIERRRRFSERDLLLDMPIPLGSCRSLFHLRPYSQEAENRADEFRNHSYVREKQQEREIIPAKPPRAVMRGADLFAGPAWV